MQRLEKTAARVCESEVSSVYCWHRSLPSFQILVFFNLLDKWISSLHKCVEAEVHILIAQLNIPLDIQKGVNHLWYSSTYVRQFQKVCQILLSFHWNSKCPFTLYIYFMVFYGAGRAYGSAQLFILALPTGTATAGAWWCWYAMYLSGSSTRRFPSFHLSQFLSLVSFHPGVCPPTSMKW